MNGFVPLLGEEGQAQICNGWPMVMLWQGGASRSPASNPKLFPLHHLSNNRQCPYVFSNVISTRLSPQSHLIPKVTL